MKIFVSSTAFDLIDIRAELEAHLRSLGLTPVMSDVRTADFDVRTGKNSIETCLINLRACDAVIVVLDKRYGPKLGKAGFDDISATHLEYREAKLAGKQILFYVRDRLEADYRLWRGERDETKRGDLGYCWVNSPKDHGLFDCLHEHQRLEPEAEHSNWFMTFRDSIELKQLVTRDLGLQASRSKLEDLLLNGQTPRLKAHLAFSEGTVENWVFLTISNPSPFSIVSLRWKVIGSDEPHRKQLDPVKGKLEWLHTGEKSTVSIRGYGSALRWVSKVVLVYQMTQGHHICDVFHVGGNEPEDAPYEDGVEYWNFFVRLESRRFLPHDPAKPLPYAIAKRNRKAE